MKSTKVKNNDPLWRFWNLSLKYEFEIFSSSSCVNLIKFLSCGKYNLLNEGQSFSIDSINIDSKTSVKYVIPESQEIILVVTHSEDLIVNGPAKFSLYSYKSNKFKEWLRNILKWI